MQSQRQRNTDRVLHLEVNHIEQPQRSVPRQLSVCGKYPVQLPKGLFPEQVLKSVPFHCSGVVVRLVGDDRLNIGVEVFPESPLKSPLGFDLPADESAVYRFHDFRAVVHWKEQNMAEIMKVKDEKQGQRQEE